MLIDTSQPNLRRQCAGRKSETVAPTGAQTGPANRKSAPVLRAAALPRAARPRAARPRADRPCAALLLAILFSAGLVLTSCASTPKSDLEVRTVPASNTVDSLTRFYPLGERRVALAGTMGEDGTLMVEAVEWFTNWKGGWTEARFFAAGRIRLEGIGQKTRLIAVEPLIIQSTDWARVRYRDTILSGKEAAAMMDRRLLRTETAALILKDALAFRSFTILKSEKKSSRADSFEYEAGAYLFPERYGYGTVNGEPAAPSANIKQNRSRGEGLDWDTVYTAALDPRLTEVRNSGTLWRDWEECTELFYLMYELE